MKLTKENIYIDLIGKSKEELTELWEFLDKVGEKQFRETLNDFLDNYYGWPAYEFSYNYWQFSSSRALNDKTEVTIEQLKEIIKPMETKFTPIAMRCNKEQFDAVKPKLEGCSIENISDFKICPYLVNNLGGYKQKISNVVEMAKSDLCRINYETWNEEIFLKACGIEIDSLLQQLQKAEAEVKRLKEEIKYKVGNKVEITITEENRKQIIELIK